MKAVLVLLSSFFTVVSATVDVTKIPAEPGENVILPCRTKNNQPAIVVEWRRNDTGEEEFVALYRGGRFDLDGQHSLYRNQVDLLDKEMKNGDVSLVLMNVTTDHTGTYECRVYQRGNKRRKRSYIKGDPICIISLDVAPPPSGDKGGLQEDGGNEDGGNKDGGNRAGLIAGLIVEIIVLASVGGLLLSRKYNHLRNTTHLLQKQNSVL